MIEEIDRSLERWLRADLPLPPGSGDLQFDQPERTWDARRSTPLVNLYLYSLHRSTSRAATGSRVVPGAQGGLAREQAVPIVEARYLVSVWGGSAAVEHELLGRVVNLLARSTTIPDEHLGDAMRGVSPRPTLSITRDEDVSVTALWAGLDVPPRPSVHLLVYSPMAVPVTLAETEPPTSVRISVARRITPAAFVPRRRVFARTGGQPRRRATVAVHDSARADVGDAERTIIDLFPTDEHGADGG